MISDEIMVHISCLCGLSTVGRIFLSIYEISRLFEGSLVKREGRDGVNINRQCILANNDARLMLRRKLNGATT